MNKLGTKNPRPWNKTAPAIIRKRLFVINAKSLRFKLAYDLASSVLWRGRMTKEDPKQNTKTNRATIRRVQRQSIDFKLMSIKVGQAKPNTPAPA